MSLPQETTGAIPPSLPGSRPSPSPPCRHLRGGWKPSARKEGGGGAPRGAVVTHVVRAEAPCSSSPVVLLRRVGGRIRRSHGRIHRPSWWILGHGAAARVVGIGLRCCSQASVAVVVAPAKPAGAGAACGGATTVAADTRIQEPTARRAGRGWPLL